MTDLERCGAVFESVYTCSTYAPLCVYIVFHVVIELVSDLGFLRGCLVYGGAAGVRRISYILAHGVVPV